jgi:hypothetical protein
MLRTRNRERILVQACIAAKQRFVVDNTNPAMRERARSVDAARAGGFRIVGYFFEPDPQAAAARNRMREAGLRRR